MNYGFSTPYDIFTPLYIISRNDDSKALGRLWAFMDSFSLNRNQLLNVKYKIQ